MPSLGLGLLLLLPPLAIGLGALAALGIRWRDDRLAFLGWAAALGALGSGGLVFALLHLDLRPGAGSLCGGALALAAALFALGRRRAPAAEEAAPEGASPEEATGSLTGAPGWERALFAVGLAALFAVGLGWILAATQVPVMEGDEAGVWHIRARLIHDAGDLTGDFQAAMDAQPRFPVHKDYPLLNPLLQVWGFGIAGELTHTSVRWPVQVLLPALLLVLAASLLRWVRPLSALLLLALFVALPQTFEQFHETKADHLVALGLLMAVDGWLRWTSVGAGARAGGTRWLALAALGATLMVVSKHEGLPLLLALAAALALGARAEVRRALARPAHAAWAAVPLLALGGVWLFNHLHGFHNTVAQGKPGGGPSFRETLQAEGFERLGVVLPFYRDSVLLGLPVFRGEGAGLAAYGRETNFLFLALLALLAAFAVDRVRRASAGAGRTVAVLATAAAALALPAGVGLPAPVAVLLWAALLLLAALGLRELGPALRVPAITVLLGLLALVGIYLGTTLSLGVAWHLGTSGVRTAHQLLPVAALWLAQALPERWPASPLFRSGTA